MSLVTYLMPPFALAYGAFFLDEPLRPSALAGFGAHPARGRARFGRDRIVPRRAATAAATMSVVLRRAALSDVPAIRHLVTHPEVEPFLSVIRATSDDELAAEIERSEAEPDAFGVLMILSDGVTAGVVYFERVNRRSRIVRVGGLAVDPALAGRGIGLAAVGRLTELLFGELGFHRIEAETYGYNTRAQTLFERAGFTREGVRRNAYWRNEEWVDGVCFGLVELELPAQ